MACCPFHDDRHPSMKVDTRFLCFGCGADGDVIDFTARLYDLSPKRPPKSWPRILAFPMTTRPRPGEAMSGKNPRRRYERKTGHGWRVLTDYYHLLRKWEADYSPKTPDVDRHPRFLEAIQKKELHGVSAGHLSRQQPPRNRISGSQNTLLKFRP